MNGLRQIEKSSGKRKKGRFRVGSHDCVHTGLLGTETLSLFKLGKHDEKGTNQVAGVQMLDM